MRGGGGDEVAGEDEDAPAAGAGEEVGEVETAGVGLVDDFVRGETGADVEIGGERVGGWTPGGKHDHGFITIVVAAVAVRGWDVGGLVFLGGEDAGTVVDGRAAEEFVQAVP